MILAALEAGGTKFVLGLVELGGEGREGPPRILWRESLPTASPEATLAASAELLEGAARSFGQPQALGIGCFGPIELRRGHPDWGRVTTTPKPGWQGAEVAGELGRRLGLPVAFDTDVNAAAAGEGRWGAGRGLSDFIYLTVGTGIGGGIVSGGRLVHGAAHPEMGHFLPARLPGDDFAGSCPYHGACLEGLASGPAIAAAWGRRAEELPADHPAWDRVAGYLARAAAAYACILAPSRIILGGGVGMRPGLAERVSELLAHELGGYLGWLSDPGLLGGYVVRPGLGHDAGLLGAAALAIEEFVPAP